MNTRASISIPSFLALGLTLCLTLCSLSCGPMDRANNNLDDMNQNMRNMQDQMTQLTQQGQALTSEAATIRASFQELVLSISTMSTFMQEVTTLAISMIFAPASSQRSEIVVPTADEVFDSINTQQTPESEDRQ